MKTPIQIGTYRLRLGWWRARDGREHKVDIKNDFGRWPWFSSASQLCWSDGGSWDIGGKESENDLVELICALDQLPLALNSAVKAAEYRVRELKQMVDETQTAWATACRLHESAQKELERLEKECEVGK